MTREEYLERQYRPHLERAAGNPELTFRLRRDLELERQMLRAESPVEGGAGRG
jgi:hypothetical protein